MDDMTRQFFAAFGTIDQPGMLSLPRVGDIPDMSIEGWQRQTCPSCQHECWVSPDTQEILNEFANNKIVIGLCTNCIVQERHRRLKINNSLHVVK